MASLAQMLKSKLKFNEAYEPEDTAGEQTRLIRSKRLFDYYVFDRDDVMDHLRVAMRDTFKEETLEQMQFPLYNLTRKIIDRLAMAYMEPANRYVVVPSASKVEGGQTTKIVDPLAKRDNEKYQAVLATSNINAAAKTWNRLAKLLSTVYVGVFYRDGKVEFEVFPPHSLTVRESSENYLEPSLVQYDRKLGGETYTFLWTADQHKVLDKDGRMAEGLNPWNGENRYGVIPLIPCRLSVTGDHWGEGDEELVGINEKVNILIASMFYNALMQSHSQAVAINLNLSDSTKGIITGPNAVIEANGIRKDDVPPEFKFVSPSPATDENIKAIDWMVKQAAMMKGLSAASVSVDASEASGVSKQVDNEELRERRQDDIEFLRPFEKRLFDLTRTVWNTNVAASEAISDRAVFGIDFEEPEKPMSAVDELAMKERKMAMGLYSPVEDMIDEDEGIDEGQALAYVLQNVKWNNQIQKAQGNGQ